MNLATEGATLQTDPDYWKGERHPAAEGNKLKSRFREVRANVTEKFSSADVTQTRFLSRVYKETMGILNGDYGTHILKWQWPQWMQMLRSTFKNYCLSHRLTVQIRAVIIPVKALIGIARIRIRHWSYNSPRAVIIPEQTSIGIAWIRIRHWNHNISSPNHMSSNAFS